MSRSFRGIFRASHHAGRLDRGGDGADRRALVASVGTTAQGKLVYFMTIDQARFVARSCLAISCASRWSSSREARCVEIPRARSGGWPDRGRGGDQRQDHGSAMTQLHACIALDLVADSGVVAAGGAILAARCRPFPFACPVPGGARSRRQHRAGDRSSHRHVSPPAHSAGCWGKEQVPGRIFLLTSEPWGDAVGARLMQALRHRRRASWRSTAWAGRAWRAVACRACFRWRSWRRQRGRDAAAPAAPVARLAQAAREVDRRQTDLVLTIALPEFALRLQRRLAGRPLVRVRPGLHRAWAWRRSW